MVHSSPFRVILFQYLLIALFLGQLSIQYTKTDTLEMPNLGTLNLEPLNLGHAWAGAGSPSTVSV